MERDAGRGLGNGDMEGHGGYEIKKSQGGGRNKGELRLEIGRKGKERVGTKTAGKKGVSKAPCN